MEIKAGTQVQVKDARGQFFRRRAVGPIEEGDSFPIVRVVREEEWIAAEREGREPEAVAWPAEDVKIDHQPAPA